MCIFGYYIIRSILFSIYNLVWDFSLNVINLLYIRIEHAGELNNNIVIRI